MKPTSAATLKPDFVSNQVQDPRRYFLDLNPPARTRLAVACGGLERCQPDYIIRRTDFRFHCVEFVAEGAGSVTLNGRRFALRPGVAFYYGPGVAHEITTDPGHPMLKYYIDFVGADAARLIASGPLAGGQAVQVSDPTEIYQLFDTLQRNGLGDGRHQTGIATALLEALLWKLAEAAPTGDTLDTQALHSFQRLKRHLDEHATTVKTLADAARAVRMNAAYACRLFQRFHNTSPYQYLLRLKMNRAAEQLLNSGKMAKEVAEELGFSDPYNFSRAFKSVYGLSPRQFQEKSGRRPSDKAV